MSIADRNKAYFRLINFQGAEASVAEKKSSENASAKIRSLHYSETISCLKRGNENFQTVSW
jgi:hypothetical protein